MWVFSSSPGVLNFFCLVYPLANDKRIIYPHLFDGPRKFTPIFSVVHNFSDTSDDLKKQKIFFPDLVFRWKTTTKKSSVLEAADFPRFHDDLKKLVKKVFSSTPDFSCLGLISKFTTRHIWVLRFGTIEN